MNDISKIKSDSNNVDETLEEISFHEWQKWALTNVSDIFRAVMGRELFKYWCFQSEHGRVNVYISPLPTIQIVFPNKLLFREVMRPYGAEIYHRLKHGDIRWKEIEFYSREGKWEKVLYIGQSKKIIWLMKAIEEIIGKIAYEEWFENPRIGRVFASIDDENILTIKTNNVFLKDYIVNQFVYRIKKAISKDHLTDIIVVSRKKPLCNYNYPLLIDSLRKEA
jgi:hypothetical protein